MLANDPLSKPSDPLDWAIRSNERHWELELDHNPLARLHLAEAWYARVETIEWQFSPHVLELKASIKGKVAEMLRTLDATLVLSDFHARRFVLKLFNDAGLRRLEQRLRVAA